MLLLMRRLGEQIVIGRDVTVTVMKLQTGQVQLGIEGPRHIPVDRLEVRRAKDACKTAAGGEET